MKHTGVVWRNCAGKIANAGDYRGLSLGWLRVTSRVFYMEHQSSRRSGKGDMMKRTTPLLIRWGCKWSMTHDELGTREFFDATQTRRAKFCNDDILAHDFMSAMEKLDEQNSEIERLQAIVTTGVEWKCAEVRQWAEWLGMRGGDPEELGRQTEKCLRALRTSLNDYHNATVNAAKET